MYRSGKYRKSIKSKVVAQVSIFIIFILTVAFLPIVYLKVHNLQEKTDLQLQNLSNEMAHDINQRLEYLKEKAELLANNELIVNAFIDKEEKESYLLPLSNNFKKGTYLSSLSILDFDGRVIFQTGKSSPKFKNSQELRLSLSLG
jgi:hypothetical protein